MVSIEEIFLFFAGGSLGSAVNILLSLEFLMRRDMLVLVSVAVQMSLSAFILYTLKRASITIRFDIIFFGSWVVSLFFATFNFVNAVVQYLPVAWYEDIPGGHVTPRFAVVINILKSLFLSSVFNVLERVTRLKK